MTPSKPVALLDDAADRPVLLDGGMGTTLEDRGVDVRNHLWASAALLSTEGLALVTGAHRDFRAAGAEILIANTHNASFSACEAWIAEGRPVPDGPGAGGAGLCRALNTRALTCAREAAGGALVAAGVGSVEGAYATAGTLTPEAAAAMLAPQVGVLRDERADLVLFETLTTRGEIGAVPLVVRDLPFGAGLTCGADGRTLAGVSMEEAVEVLLPAGPAALFVQCTAFDLVPPALDRLRRAVDGRVPVGVYANDGRTWEDMRWHGERTTPEEYADAAESWVRAGARLVGGCCGTAPEHVAELARRLRVR